MDENCPDRSIDLTMDRIEREAKRAAQAKAMQSRFAGAEGRPGSAAEAEALAQRIARLTQCHRVAYRPRDWAAVAARPRVQVVRTKDREAEARRVLHAYRPSWFEQLFGAERDKRRHLAARVAEAAAEDEAAYRAAWKAAQEQNAEIDLACRLAELDLKTIQAGLAEHTTLAEALDVVQRHRFAVPAKGRFQILLEAHDLAALPFEEAERQPNGRALFRPMPPGRAHQAHGANVCASALRFAVEMLGYLPLDRVEVIVHGELRDARSGLFARHPILQMTLTHAQAVAAPFQRTEALPLAAQLGARLNWTIERGFAPST